jgi:soluble lytic murein transglycosylase
LPCAQLHVFTRSANPFGALVLLAVLSSGPVARAGPGDDEEPIAARPPGRAERSPPATPDARAVPFDGHWLEPYFASGPMRAAVERFRLDDWAGAAEQLTRALAELPRRAPDRLPGRFLLALSRANLGQWEAAGALFEELHTSYPLLAPYHAYHAARCRLRRGDTAGARSWAEQVPAGTVPEAEAALLKIDALSTEQRWTDVDREAAAYLARFIAGPRRVEASFRRAEALSALGRPAAEVAPLYRSIWAEAPAESWAARAAERLAALAAAATPELAAALQTRTASEWVQRGMVLFDRNQNTESETAFASALTAPGLNAALECKARYHRAQSVWKQRQRARAAPLFGEAEGPCRTAADDDLLVKSQYQGARCLANAGDKAAATALFAKIEAEHPRHSYADDARLRQAEIASELGNDALATSLLAEIPTRYPGADLIGESVWRLAFRAWRAGNWAEARRWLDENLRLVPHEEIWYAEGRALYWKGRIAEKEGNPEEARASYTRAVREYPLSVYAMLALERLRLASPATRAALMKELRPAPAGTAARGKVDLPAAWQFAPQPVFGEPSFLRGVELARLGLGTEARRELARLGFAAPESRDAARRAEATPIGEARADIYWITAILLDRGRLWSASHAIPRYTLTSYRLGYPSGRRAREWQLAYPRAFPELVARNSRANQVPEALQLAIMREESAFNPRTESFANALGLTQLLVRTAQIYVPYRVTREMLLEPARNLEIGSRFLAFLLKRYGGAVPLAIAGYNAGEGAVDRWVNEHARDMALDEFLESIPYDETRNYTKRVLASYAAYTWLYFPARPVPQLAFDLRPPVPSRAGRPAQGRRR